MAALNCVWIIQALLSDPTLIHVGSLLASCGSSAGLWGASYLELGGRSPAYSGCSVLVVLPVGLLPSVLSCLRTHVVFLKG